MDRAIPVLGAVGVPALCRRNYAIEFRHLLLWCVLIGSIEGNIAGIVAYKTFGASPLLTSICWAIPVFMNTLSLFWGVVIRGRPRAPLMFRLAGAVLACALSLALVPPEPRWGGWLFAGLLALTHFFFTGLTTLRSSIWNAAYPKSHRGRIVGNLQSLRLTMIMLSGAAVAWVFDSNALYYRLVYPAVVLIGLASLVPLRRLKIRGEGRELRAYRQRNGEPRSRSLLAEFRGGLREAGEILRRDRRFAHYMNAQFLLGAASFSTDGVLVRAIPEALGLGYYASSFLMLQLPVAVMLLSIRYWAPYFDRVGAVHFRVRNTAFWLVVYACTSAAMLLAERGGPAWMWLTLTLLVLGRAAQGFCQGGGAIAWTIGHLHFAPGDQSDLYMGIHVALTGLRGMLMPLLSVWLNATIGNASFAVSVVFAASAYVLFRRLARGEPVPEEAVSTYAGGLDPAAVRSDTV